MPTGTIITLIILDLLLMAFAVVLGLMSNETLTATAGAGAIGLTADIARRLLAPPPAVPAGAQPLMPGTAGPTLTASISDPGQAGAPDTAEPSR
jgi:hypothetical protein